MSAPRWRAMRTAPKDGTYILLAYPSFADLGESVSVGYATWVDTPHYGAIKAAAEDAFYRGNASAVKISPTPHDPHWELFYMSNVERAVPFHTAGSVVAYSCASIAIRDPIAWMPCPKPPKPRKSL